MIKRVFLALFGTALFIGVGITAFMVASHMLKTDSKKAMRAHAPMPVTLAQARTTAIKSEIGAAGETQETERIVLTARLSQPVMSVTIGAGNRVTKGQILLSFEQGLLQSSCNQASESVRRAKSRREYCELTYARLQRLYDQKLIARVELETAIQQLNDAQWQLQTAIGQLERATQDLSYITVHSPITGVVLERSINPGETPRLDEALVTLGAIDRIFLKARVPEKEITQVHLRQQAKVVFDSFRNEDFAGEIVKIDPSSDTNTKTFNAYIELPNVGLRLTPGLTAFARIYNSKTALAIPSICIVNPMGDVATVFTVDSNSVARVQPVKTGVSGGGLTEILGGLNEGDQVVAAGLEFLRDGQTVNVMEDRT